jgi:hypothetical protein
MDRRAALALAFAATAATAVAWAKPRPRKSAASKTPTALHVRGVDLAHRLVLIEAVGLSKPPQSNFFTLTDDRGRHYIAQSIHCDPPFPSGARPCELEIPFGYERHPLTAVELHLRGLHGRSVVAAPDEVRAAWAAAAEAHAPPTLLATPAGQSGVDGGAGAALPAAVIAAPAARGAPGGLDMGR